MKRNEKEKERHIKTESEGEKAKEEKEKARPILTSHQSVVVLSRHDYRKKACLSLVASW